MQIGTLTLHRFNGDEIWNLTKGGFSVIDWDDEAIITVWAGSNGELISPPLEDTYDSTHPTLELQMAIPYTATDKLVDSKFEFTLTERPEDDDVYFSNFYYYGHEFTHHNSIAVIEQKDNFYHIIASATTTDVNFYDGSKPDNLIVIDCWLPRSSKKTGYWTYRE